MSARIDVLAVMRWHHHIIKGLHEASGGEDHALDLEDAELAVTAVIELIAAAREVQADAAILGMEIPRLDAALAAMQPTSHGAGVSDGD